MSAKRMSHRKRSAHRKWLGRILPEHPRGPGLKPRRCRWLGRIYWRMLAADLVAL